MSTWAGISYGPATLCETQNHLNTWYFRPSERKIENTGDADFPVRYVYRSPKGTISRRLALDGFDAHTLEQDFNISIRHKIEACRCWITEGLDRDGANSALLAALEESTLRDWLDRLKRIFTDNLESAAYERSRDYGDPILNYMLSGYHDFYFEDSHFSASYNFPCSTEEMYAVVLIMVVPNEEDFVLDATAMISSGWTDKFEDFIEHHSEHTTFFNTFKLSLAKTLALGNLAPDNQDLARLLYANVITVFEAYISDTITKQVLNRKAILRRFVQNHQPFIKTKEAKSDVFKTYEGILEEARRELRETSFHNPVTAKKLYHDVLATSFPENIAELIKAVDVRHDIVHRNGKSQNNVEVRVTIDDVKNVAALVESTVLYIDAQIKDAILERDDES